MQTVVADIAIKQAIRRVTGNADPQMVKAIRSRIRVRNPGGSEIVSVSLRGRVFRDQRDFVIDILNNIVESSVNKAGSDQTQLVQPAVIPNGR